MKAIVVMKMGRIGRAGCLIQLMQIQVSSGIGKLMFLVQIYIYENYQIQIYESVHVELDF